MKKSDRLYRIWNGRVTTATFVRAQILDGATLPSWTIRYDDGRQAITSPGDWELTKLQAWKRYRTELADAIPGLSRAEQEARHQLARCRDEIELATGMIDHLTESES